mgnify:CR=1 FL=1
MMNLIKCQISICSSLGLQIQTIKLNFLSIKKFKSPFVISFLYRPITESLNAKRIRRGFALRKETSDVFTVAISSLFGNTSWTSSTNSIKWSLNAERICLWSIIYIKCVFYLNYYNTYLQKYVLDCSANLLRCYVFAEVAP